MDLFYLENEMSLHAYIYSIYIERDTCMRRKCYHSWMYNVICMIDPSPSPVLASLALAAISKHISMTCPDNGVFPAYVTSALQLVYAQQEKSPYDGTAQGGASCVVSLWFNPGALPSGYFAQPNEGWKSQMCWMSFKAKEMPWRTAAAQWQGGSGNP